MIRITNGLRYDTSKAQHIASDCSDPAVLASQHYQEGLYLTKKGRWFLAGEGGPLSRWGTHDTLSGPALPGKGIEPMEPEEARSWLEERKFTAELEKYFAEEVEDA